MEAAHSGAKVGSTTLMLFLDLRLGFNRHHAHTARSASKTMAGIRPRQPHRRFSLCCSEHQLWQPLIDDDLAIGGDDHQATNQSALRTADS